MSVIILNFIQGGKDIVPCPHHPTYNTWTPEFMRQSIFPKGVQNLYVILAEETFCVLTEVFEHLISCI